MFDKIFSSKRDDKSVNQSLNKKEADAEAFIKKKCIKSNLICNKSSF